MVNWYEVAAYGTLAAALTPFTFGVASAGLCVPMWGVWSSSGAFIMGAAYGAADSDERERTYNSYFSEEAQQRADANAARSAENYRWQNQQRNARMEANRAFDRRYR